jgi:kinesin family protein 18/19
MRSREQRYVFDHIFTKEPIEHIYEKTVFDLVDPLFKGYNGCVFAYGPTGTGKTHTMLGNNSVDGLCSLSLKAIFDKRRCMPNHEILINVSYVEIYNEQIRDLLIPNHKENYLDLREDPIKGVSLAGATEFKVDSVEEVMNLLFQGNKRRTTEATNANQTSSRSHAVFQICVSVNPRCKDVNIERVLGKLSLIDLAGSERGTVTENRGLRLREGAKINQSLLALANCINALGDKNKKGSFVPYRDSKLTRMLKDSLGGNCKTVMIVTISPSSSQFEETLNTLKYANRAKNITTKPVENKKLVEFHIAEYKNIIRDLRTEIDSLRLKVKPQTSLEENDNCVFCTCGREQDSIEAEKIKQELFENFQERIQIRRGLCELEAQNQLNEMEIKQGQEKLMRYTLSRSGKLIAKENCESADEFTNLPSNLRKQLSDIKKLKVSMDHNFCKKEIMQKELVLKAEKAQSIMSSIPSRVKHRDKKDFLEIVVKNYILQLENDELEYNLNLQEKLNIILVEEIKRLRTICSSNGVMLSEKEEEEDDFGFEVEEKPRNNISSVSPQRKFTKKLSSNQSLYEKTKTFEKIENAEKVASEKKMVGSNTELVLPPIKEFNTPKNKIDHRIRGQSRKSKEMRQEYTKVDQEVRNAINAITSLNNIGTESNLNDRKAKLEVMKKQLKNPKGKTSNKLPPPRELSIKK